MIKEQHAIVVESRELTPRVVVLSVLQSAAATFANVHDTRSLDMYLRAEVLPVLRLRSCCKAS